MVVVVMGPPRSGTSMWAGLLSILGVDMGETRGSDGQNPKGYFEDRAAMRVGRRAFNLADPNWTGFDPPDPELVLAHRDELDEYVRNFVRKRKQPVWGWKTIHTGLLFELFVPYLEDPRIVVALRNPLNVARSCVAYTRAKKALYESLDLVECLCLTNFYQRHIFEALANHPEIPTMFGSYREAVENPRATLEALAEFSSISVDSSQLRRAEEFVG